MLKYWVRSRRALGGSGRWGARGSLVNSR